MEDFLQPSFWPGKYSSEIDLGHDVPPFYIISWSINNSCETKNGITHLFTTYNISWPCVNFSQFLLKWVSFPANCKFGIFPGNKVFTKGWTFIRDSSGINSGNFLDKGAYLKSLFNRRRSATISTRKSLKCYFLGASCFSNMRSELLAKKNLIIFSE